MDFEQVEDAIIAEIQTAMPDLGTCETYAGQLEGDLNNLAITYPAVFVSYGGSMLDWIDMINFNEAVVFNLLVCAENLRGQEAARKDTDTGAYKMIRDVLTALTNKDLGLSIEKLKPVKVSLLFITKSIAVYGIEFQTNFDNAYE
ncbi:MAG: DUF1834 family protein [Nitrospirae bacterium]|nr:DUF1834 family protein [Nitrospirota bacterium]